MRTAQSPHLRITGVIQGAVKKHPNGQENLNLGRLLALFLLLQSSRNRLVMGVLGGFGRQIGLLRLLACSVLRWREVFYAFWPVSLAYPAGARVVLSHLGPSELSFG